MPEGPFSKIFGLARFVEEDAKRVLNLSGKEIFFDPSKKFAMPPFTVEWVAQEDAETASDYLKRVRNMPSYMASSAGIKSLAAA